MKIRYFFTLYTVGTLAVVPLLAQEPQPITLNPLGTYASGSFELGAAEIVAHDPQTQRAFVVNAQAATIDVLNLQNASNPTKIASLDVTPYGAVANSVAVREGIIAVAVENVVKTDPGVVVFFDSNLQFRAKVTVGSLPDMLTFTPNGRYVLVANEGEPNADYSVDPEGSVSVIDLTGGLAKVNQSAVRHARFTRFNAAPLDASVRIFGPNASVAKDLEPEYIAVSHDSKTAWVTCQENNAIAVIDIASATVKELIGLGFKDHSAHTARTEIFSFDPASLPEVGKTLAGQSIFLGGFSGLFFEGIDTVTGNYKFVAHTDRGPNAEPTGILRPFLLPDFTPEIVRFTLDRPAGRLEITERIPLQKAPRVPLTGLPNTKLSSNPNQAFNDEVPVALLGNELPLDPLGADLEGIVVDPSNGSFWMSMNIALPSITSVHRAS